MLQNNIQDAQDKQLASLKLKKENLEKKSKSESEEGEQSPTKEQLLKQVHDLKKKLAMSEGIKLYSSLKN